MKRMYRTTLAVLLGAGWIAAAGAAVIEPDSDLHAELSEGFSAMTILILAASAGVIGLAAWIRKRLQDSADPVRQDAGAARSPGVRQDAMADPDESLPDAA